MTLSVLYVTASVCDGLQPSALGQWSAFKETAGEQDTPLFSNSTLVKHGLCRAVLSKNATGERKTSSWPFLLVSRELRDADCSVFEMFCSNI